MQFTFDGVGVNLLLVTLEITMNRDASPSHNILRATAFSALALLGANALAGCTGQRPTLRPESRGTSAEQTASCSGDEFRLPASESYDVYDPYNGARHYTEMAIPTDKVESTLQSLRVSESIENSTSVISDVFNGLNAEVHVAEVPQKSVSHLPEAVNQHLLDVSFRHVVEVLSEIPEPIAKDVLKDVDIYFSASISNSSGALSGLIQAGDKPGRTAIVLSLDVDVNTGSEFRWAMASLVADRLCGGNDKTLLAEYTDRNPVDFEYSADGQTDSEQYYKSRRMYAVVNDSSMTDPETDLTEMIEALISPRSERSYILGGCKANAYGTTSPAGDQPFCHKASLVLTWIADSSGEDTANQLAARL